MMIVFLYGTGGLAWFEIRLQWARCRLKPSCLRNAAYLPSRFLSISHSLLPSLSVSFLVSLYPPSLSPSLSPSPLTQSLFNVTSFFYLFTSYPLISLSLPFSPFLSLVSLSLSSLSPTLSPSPFPRLSLPSPSPHLLPPTLSLFLSLWIGQSHHSISLHIAVIHELILPPSITAQMDS